LSRRSRCDCRGAGRGRHADIGTWQTPSTPRHSTIRPTRFPLSPLKDCMTSSGKKGPPPERIGDAGPRVTVAKLIRFPVTPDPTTGRQRRRRSIVTHRPLIMS